MYSRADLLFLATSPYSHEPVAHDLVEQYPFVLKEHGEEIHRALSFTPAAPTFHSRRPRGRGRQGRRGGAAKVDSATSDIALSAPAIEGAINVPSSAPRKPRRGRKNLDFTSRASSSARGSDSDRW